MNPGESKISITDSRPPRNVAPLRPSNYRKFRCRLLQRKSLQASKTPTILLRGKFYQWHFMLGILSSHPFSCCADVDLLFLQVRTIKPQIRVSICKKLGPSSITTFHQVDNMCTVYNVYYSCGHIISTFVVCAKKRADPRRNCRVVNNDSSQGEVCEHCEG
jgi:hypothetical protein